MGDFIAAVGQYVKKQLRRQMEGEVWEFVFFHFQNEFPWTRLTECLVSHLFQICSNVLYVVGFQCKI